MKLTLIMVGIMVGASLFASEETNQPTNAITITSGDMFSAVGQSYRVYANKANVDVSGLLGNPGGPQTWNFTNGPQDITYRFDYVDINDGGNGGDFRQAKFAERQTDEAKERHRPGCIWRRYLGLAAAIMDS